MSTVTQPVPTRESPAASTPRIGYDARFSLGQYRGMGRYLRRLLRCLPECAVGFSASGENDDTLQLRTSGFHFYPLWEQVSLPRRVAESRVKFFIAPYNTAPLSLPGNVKLILVVHDLIYLRSRAELPLSRSTYQNVGRFYRRLVVPGAVHRADHIICVSQYTRQELMRRFDGDVDKITVIPNTIDASWYRLQALPSDYVLCVSGEAPNKNLEAALEGFAGYCRTTRDRNTLLKVAGVKSAYHGEFRRLAERLGIADRVEFLAYLTDPALQSLYEGARAFLFPSREEGFGVPVLEALATGIPVVASNSSSIPEVAGTDALYFHPDAPHEIADQLCTLLSNPQLQRTMSQLGRRRSELFHPDAVDPIISQFWDRVLAP
jgi:glycosyltransferase involved in cell wall biosynthesis